MAQKKKQSLLQGAFVLVAATAIVKVIGAAVSYTHLDVYKRQDLPSGSEEDIFRSLRKLSQLPGDYRVLPGHGSETQLEFERRNNPFMRG